jgi:hypothetical protein
MKVVIGAHAMCWLYGALMAHGTQRGVEQL